MDVTAEMVKELREKTGARLMDCKQALKETGDPEKAMDWIKKKNLDIGATSSGKPATEGLLGYKDEGGAITVVELSSNTDFVAKNDEFHAIMKKIVDAAHATAGLVGDALMLELKELSGKMGENIGVKRIVRVSGVYGHYIHFDNKQGAVVELEGAAGEVAQDIGKDIAMHIVFAKPDFLDRDKVPTEEITRERAIIDSRLKEDPKMAEKPPQIVEKIVTGQLAKFFSKKVLVEQPHYREDKKTVAQVLKEKGVTVKHFERFQVGVV